MFEMYGYMNYGMLFISILISIILFILIYIDTGIEDKYMDIFFKAELVLIILLNCYLPYNSMKNSQLNQLSFLDEKRLTCLDRVNEDILVDITISKDAGWSIDGNYFSKNNTSIKSSLCEVINYKG